MDRAGRILWVTDRHPPLGGGMARSSARLVEGLRGRGLEVDVLAFTSTAPGTGINVEHRDRGRDWRLSRTAPPGVTAQQAWRLLTLETAGRPFTHVVGFGAGRPGHLAVTYAAWLDLPSVVLVRGNDFDQDWFDPRRGPLVKESLARAATIGAVAPDLVDRIQALFPGADVRFVPNGVDPGLWELLPADEALRDETRAKLSADGRAVIGLFGELKYKKGVAFWLGALRDAGLTGRVALLLVGRRLDEETRQVLDDPVLSPPSLRLPFADPDRLAGLYAACDFVALPSLWEGLPNVLLEAMACGVPPLVSEAGAMGRLVQDGVTGFVFPVLDRAKAAQATARALDLDPSERAAMGRRARRFIAENYSLEKETEALLDLLGLGTDHGPGRAS
ncbi:MAG: glycosyltransferase family 4 protein [Thermodesulfobacteriota bacterium]